MISFHGLTRAARNVKQTRTAVKFNNNDHDVRARTSRIFDIYEQHNNTFSTGYIKSRREKERNLTQSYDENPYTNIKFNNQLTTKTPPKLRLHNDYGPT